MYLTPSPTLAIVRCYKGGTCCNNEQLFTLAKAFINYSVQLGRPVCHHEKVLMDCALVGAMNEWLGIEEETKTMHESTKKAAA